LLFQKNTAKLVHQDSQSKRKIGKTLFI